MVNKCVCVMINVEMRCLETITDVSRQTCKDRHTDRQTDRQTDRHCQRGSEVTQYPSLGEGNIDVGGRVGKEDGAGKEMAGGAIRVTGRCRREREMQ